MLSPVGAVSSTSPINPAPFDTGTPVANADTRQLQLERQLQLYNQQLAVAQEAARRADQLQQQIAAVQQQLEQRQVENTRAENLRADEVAEDLAAERLRTDNVFEDRQAEELRADDLVADRLADERLAADRLAAEQLAEAQDAIAQNLITEAQLRTTIEDNDPVPATDNQSAEPAASNEDLIPPLAPDDSGRLINTLV